MYDRLMEGKVLKKREEMERFHVGARTIQRDLDDIRAYLSESRSPGRELIFSKKKMGYVIRSQETCIVPSPSPSKEGI